MTEEPMPPLKRFTPSSPFGRRRTKTEIAPTKVDPMEDAFAAAQGMPKLLTSEEVAAWFGVTERTLERWRMTGDGPPYVSLSRGTVRYCEEALTAFVAARVKQNTAQ